MWCARQWTRHRVMSHGCMWVWTKPPDQRGWFFPALWGVGGDSVQQRGEACSERREKKEKQKETKTYATNVYKFLQLEKKWNNLHPTHHNSVCRDFRDSMSFSWHAIYKTSIMLKDGQSQIWEIGRVLYAWLDTTVITQGTANANLYVGILSKGTFHDYKLLVVVTNNDQLDKAATRRCFFFFFSFTFKPNILIIQKKKGSNYEQISASYPHIT